MNQKCKHIAKINETKSCFFEEQSKFARFIKKKEKRPKYNKIINKKEINK